jgi:CubicO group peptidase (beta-lactamase class C family)
MLKTTRPRGWSLSAGLMAVMLGGGVAPIAGSAGEPAVTGPQDRFEGVGQRIRWFMQRNRVPAVSVAVAHQGRIAWEEAFGNADREAELEATPETPFRLASISKVVTATGLMTLVERGLIDLDAPVADYLGDLELPTSGFDLDAVTPRRILHQTAGFPMYWESFYAPDTTEVPTLRESLERYAVVGYPPGERAVYSNIGFGVLEYVIEQISLTTFDRFLEREVFDPLGMDGTRVLGASGGNAATVYDTAGERMPFGIDPVKSHGSVAATAGDLARFGMLHLRQRTDGVVPILSDETIDIMQHDVDPVSAYRLPWTVQDWNGYEVVFFTGATGTILLLVPSEDLVVVVLANRMFANTVQVGQWILGAALPEYARRASAPASASATSDDDDGFRPPPELLGTWEGAVRTYEGEVPVRLVFGSEGSVRFARRDSVPDDPGVPPMESLAVEYWDRTFAAHFPMALPLTAAERHQHWTWLTVTQVGDTLRGFATAHAADAPLFGLPSYVELRRQ